MYVPLRFKDSDPEALRQRIRQQPLGTLVVQQAGEMEANHLPFILCGDGEGEQLQAHVPRDNPLSQLSGHHPVLIIFHGPQGYISPSWYATKAEQGRVVPTWNYAVTHVQGVLRVVDDPHWVRQQITQLTDQQEQGRTQPWSVDDAPEEFIENMCNALVGLEIQVLHMEGKNKASQNQPAINQASLLDALKHAPESGPLYRHMLASLEEHKNNE